MGVAVSLPTLQPPIRDTQDALFGAALCDTPRLSGWEAGESPASVAFRLVPQPPSGTVTFLFTDIEGSTQLWESVPDTMRPALERHDELVRSAIDAHGGYVFSTGGDGFAVAFGRAGDAVNAAIAMQQALA